MSVAQLFTDGEHVISHSGIDLSVVRLLGEGGQGQVYEVESGGIRWAMKYYTKEAFATRIQYENLKHLIEIGSPSPTFLWPIDLVQRRDDPFFGYLMALRPLHYTSLIDYVKRRINPTFHSLITAAFNLADSFSKLHARGLCYRDISFGNVFIDPTNGDVLICDNDNVCYNNDGLIPSIGGTSGFMAPEIVLGTGVPSVNTDLYSLSVLLFYLLFISHPLNGIRETQVDCWDPEAERRLYGSEALFIFDPTNDANHPDEKEHRNAILFWDIYPKSIKSLFTTAFTDGLYNSDNGRVRENEWKHALIQLRNSLITCLNCSSQVFYDPSVLSDPSASNHLCWNCRVPIIVPPRIRIGNDIIMLNTDTTLYQYHLNPTSFDIDTVVARINKHPTMNMYGLQNLCHQNWTVISPDGKTAEVNPQRNVPLRDGMVIDFGSVRGEIRVTNPLLIC
jgi:DNA-binding helix-hairpin-helix protein with protein kinase domain